MMWKNHHMHSEFYMIDEEAAEKINRAKENGRKVICGNNELSHNRISRR